MNDQPITTVGDVTSVGITIAAFAGWLPTVASVLSIIWVLIRIYETQTVQRLLGKEPADDQDRPR